MDKESLLKKLQKTLLIKILAILCSVLLLWSSPYTSYMEISNIDTVYATEVIVAESAKKNRRMACCRFCHDWIG